MYFKAFLSHRYGSTPLRENIKAKDFEKILKNMKNEKSILFRGINLAQYCYESAPDDNNIEETKYYKLKSKKDMFNQLQVILLHILIYSTTLTKYRNYEL